MAKKSWVEKRDCGKMPHVKVLDKPFAGIKDGCKMLITSPTEIDQFIRSIPKGKLIQPSEMREQLAKRHGADATCPVSTGIFLKIVAEAAIEEKNNGKPIKEITPFWRVIDCGSPLAQKLSIDQDELAMMQSLGDV
jgi:hypothetical protein